MFAREFFPDIVKKIVGVHPPLQRYTCDFDESTIHAWSASLQAAACEDESHTLRGEYR